MQDGAVYCDDVIYLKFLTEQELLGNYPNWFSNPQVCQFNQHGKFPVSATDCKAYVESLKQSRTLIVWAVYHVKDNTHIGNISLQSINWVNRSAEVALLFGEQDYWGKGHATAAMRHVLFHAFENLNLHRLYCGTAITHTAMLKLAQKLGFIKEGEHRHALFLNGEYVNTIQFGLLRNEYQNNKPRQV